MTNFAGEEFVVEHIAFGPDDVPLTDVDIPSVTLTIFDLDAVTKLVDEETMTWAPDVEWSARVHNVAQTGTGLWRYVWDSDGLPAGTYKGRATVHGVGGGKNWEELRLRLANDPLPA